MPKNKTAVIVMFLVAAGLAASLIVHRRADVALRERQTIFQQQEKQIAALKAEQQRLSNLVARATNTPVSDHSAEIAKLREQADAFKKQTNELAKKFKPGPAPKTTRYSLRTEDHTSEFWQEWHAGTKLTEASSIAEAMSEYAYDHQNQFPSNLDQITSYLAKNQHVLSGTNRFEIIYQGSLDQLKGIPETSVAIVRDTQTWLTPDGRQVRIYGMVSGIGKTVTSDDNFQSWEAEHVISPPATSQPAR